MTRLWMHVKVNIIVNVLVNIIVSALNVFTIFTTNMFRKTVLIMIIMFRTTEAEWTNRSTRTLELK